MSYKTIAVVVADQTHDAAALNAACQLARSHGAHLEVLALGVDHARLNLAPMGGGGVIIDAGLIDNDRARALESATALADWAQDVFGKDTVVGTVQPVVIGDMELDGALAHLVRYADLIVASQPYVRGSSNLTVAVIEAELFGTGAPVLMVPAGTADLSAGPQRVMVAWNGSAESLAAVRRALPLLQAAAKVDIVIVDPSRHAPERSDPGGAVCLLLARHGVSAEVVILSQTLPRLADVVLRYAREHGVGAIVMGAYGHSRFREMVLGGATRNMLEQSDLPLLMAH